MMFATDSLGRLQEQIFADSDTTRRLYDAYDAVGNRTDSGASIATGNRLTSFDGYTLSWDAAGRWTR